jgi:hypothetical protein
MTAPLAGECTLPLDNSLYAAPIGAVTAWEF